MFRRHPDEFKNSTVLGRKCHTSASSGEKAAHTTMTGRKTTSKSGPGAPPNARRQQGRATRLNAHLEKFGCSEPWWPPNCCRVILGDNTLQHCDNHNHPQQHQSALNGSVFHLEQRRKTQHCGCAFWHPLSMPSCR